MLTAERCQRPSRPPVRTPLSTDAPLGPACRGRSDACGGAGRADPWPAPGLVAAVEAETRRWRPGGTGGSRRGGRGRRALSGRCRGPRAEPTFGRLDGHNSLGSGPFAETAFLLVGRLRGQLATVDPPRVASDPQRLGRAGTGSARCSVHRETGALSGPAVRSGGMPGGAWTAFTWRLGDNRDASYSGDHETAAADPAGALDRRPEVSCGGAARSSATRRWTCAHWDSPARWPLWCRPPGVPAPRVTRSAHRLYRGPLCVKGTPVHYRAMDDRGAASSRQRGARGAQARVRDRRPRSGRARRSWRR